MTLIAEPLDATGFAAFGTVIEVPAEAGRTGPVPVIADPRSGTTVGATLIRYAAAPRPFRTAEIERHPHSNQLFLNLSAGRLLVLVLPADAAGAPDPAGARAFVARPGQGFAYRPGLWHAGLAGLDEGATVASLLSRDGSPADVELRRLPTPIEVTWS